MARLLVPRWICVVMALCLVASSRSADFSQRVANTTLRMPPNGPSFNYTTADAFGNLTFSRPVALVVAPGDTNRLFVVEQTGQIAVITNLAAPTRTTFLDISGRVQFGSEEGLLALAFHPGYATNRYFYVWYTTRSPRHDRLSRFEIDPNNPLRALPESEQILINQQDDAENHNGGELLFGPDGYLYLSIGDEGLSASLDNFQRIDRDFFAGIFRIDVDKRPESISPNSHPANAGFNYAIPPDNPFVGVTNFNGRPVDPANVRTEFWAVGLRNPWRMSFDEATGLLYCGDVGQKEIEEVDIIVKGRNYGWPFYEGSRLNSGFQIPSGFSHVPPILEYRHGDGTEEGLCVIGGFVYRGNRYPDLYGAYIFADNVSGHVWTVRYDPANTNTTGFSRIAFHQDISTFGQNPANGEILMAVHYEGRIKRLVRSTGSGESFPPTLAETGAFSDLGNLIPNAGIVPYEINVPFWSDYAHKSRWFSVPDINSLITYSDLGNWLFPTGTVWIKHFDLELTNGVPASARRLETRFLVRSERDGIYGLTYRWGESLTDAVLVPEEGMNETFLVNRGGALRTQTWRYPSRSECLRCHTSQAGFALGFNTPQLNCGALYEGAPTNQISALSLAGYLNTNVYSVAGLPVLARATNSAFSVEHRVRSYFHANCVQCHRPGGSVQALWDARITTPLSSAGIINGALIDYLGDTNNRVVVPLSLSNSVAYTRIAAFGADHMPPLATSELNEEAMALLSLWITNDLADAPPVAGVDTIWRHPSGGTRVLISDLLANDSDANDEIEFVSVNSTSVNGAVVSRQGDWISYEPPSGFTNEDAFTYQITDGRSEPVTGTVNVLTSNDTVPSPNLHVTDLGNGSYRIRFDGIPELTYTIEYTPTLNPPQWQILGSETADSNGMFEIIDTPPPGFGQRFYRSVYP